MQPPTIAKGLKNLLINKAEQIKKIILSMAINRKWNNV